MSAELEGVEWALVGGSGQTLLIDGGHAAGSGGCNRFAGGYALAGERLTFQPLALTRMACAPETMQAESDYLAALTRTAHTSLADGELVLFDAAGVELLRFAPATPATDQEEPTWS
jgi:heat shock protein HslJ